MVRKPMPGRVQVKISGGSGIYQFRCLTNAALDWCKKHCQIEDWQWHGSRSFVVEGKANAVDIAQGLARRGFVVK